MAAVLVRVHDEYRTTSPPTLAMWLDGGNAGGSFSGTADDCGSAVVKWLWDAPVGARQPLCTHSGALQNNGHNSRRVCHGAWSCSRNCAPPQLSSRFTEARTSFLYQRYSSQNHRNYRYSREKRYGLVGKISNVMLDLYLEAQSPARSLSFSVLSFAAASIYFTIQCGDPGGSLGGRCVLSLLLRS